VGPLPRRDCISVGIAQTDLTHIYAAQSSPITGFTRCCARGMRSGDCRAAAPERNKFAASHDGRAVCELAVNARSQNIVAGAEQPPPTQPPDDRALGEPSGLEVDYTLFDLLARSRFAGPANCFSSRYRLCLSDRLFKYQFYDLVFDGDYSREA